MDKYIHIEDLKDYLNRQIQAFEPCPDKYDAAVGIYDGLHRIPAADVAPIIHGKWKTHYREYSTQPWGYNCSICEKWISPAPWEPRPNYCPNCGAKMDGDGE